jgi:hypothetical protein
MAADLFWTTRGLYRLQKALFNGDAFPATLKVALVVSVPGPTRQTKTMAELTEVAAGHGYSAGGLTANRNATDFPTVAEDDITGFARAVLKDLSFTASGGDIPISGDAAGWVVFTDDNATVIAREVWLAFKLPGAVTIPSGQSLTLKQYTPRLFA